MLVSRSRTGQAFSLLSLLLSSGVGQFIPLTPSTDRFPLYNTPLHHQFIALLYASTSSSSHSLSDRFCNACVIEVLWCLLITPVNLSQLLSNSPTKLTTKPQLICSHGKQNCVFTYRKFTCLSYILGKLSPVTHCPMKSGTERNSIRVKIITHISSLQQWHPPKCASPLWQKKIPAQWADSSHCRYLFINQFFYTINL